MNTGIHFFSAAIISFSALSFAQDTVSSVPDSGKWFTDTNSGVDQDAPPEKNVLGSPADTASPADPDSTYTIVVTATRRDLPSEWVSDDHEVIDIAQVRQNSAKSVSEIISSRIPARFTDNGGGAVKTVSLMGAGSERTLILVDGKRTGTTAGDLGDLSPETIEKIEVIEGGQSAQYGMDAVGGVVNIVTKRGTTDKWSGNFSATTAAYEPENNRPRVNTQGYQLSLGKKIGRIESFSAADFSLSDGRYEYDVSGTTFRMGHNDFRDWGVYQKLGFSISDITLNAALSLRDRKADNPGSLIWHDTGTTKKNVGYLTLDGSWRANERLRLKANAAIALNNIRYEPVSVWYGPSSHEYLNGDIELVQEFTFGKQLLTTGLQGMRQSVSSSDLGFHVGEQGSAFASAVLSRTADGVDVRAMPAVRFDYSSIFKSAFNGRLGIMATFPRVQAVEPSVFANIGSSYRSPTFIDLYWPYGMGNPDLKKERSFDVDGGIQVRTGNGDVSISNRAAVFLMRLNDMIVPDNRWKPQNLDKASITGFKFKSQFRYSHTYDAAVDFVYNNARNGMTDNVLKFRPRYIATMSNQLSVQRLTAGFAVRYSSQVFTDDANTQSLPASITAEVNLGITLMRCGADGSGIKLVYDALNITNEDRMDAAGYPLPKREHRLSLKAGF